MVDRPQPRESSTYDADACDLLLFAQAVSRLGDAAAAQVLRLTQDGPATDINPAAIALAQEHLGGFNAELDVLFQEYFETVQHEGTGSEPVEREQSASTPRASAPAGPSHSQEVLCPLLTDYSPGPPRRDWPAIR
jgi:hypothetical protein